MLIEDREPDDGMEDIWVRGKEVRVMDRDSKKFLKGTVELLPPPAPFAQRRGQWQRLGSYFNCFDGLLDL